MKPINLYTLINLPQNSSLCNYECHLSDREQPITIKPHEFSCLISLVNKLCHQCSVNDFDGFFYSYSIPQIGKEFDLLRISNQLVLNIEIKTEATESTIKEQLDKNKYYLKHLSRDLQLFCYVQQVNKLYYADENMQVKECEWEFLINLIINNTDFFVENINDLFKVSQFLVSPINCPETFLKQEYFLTLQQDQFKKEFISLIQTSVNVETKYHILTGGPGTGKTLLLYDIAMYFAKNGLQVCIIHCGMMSNGHDYINQQNVGLEIFPIKDLNKINFSSYNLILFDESQRLLKQQIQYIFESLSLIKVQCIFSLDQQQTLSKSEAINAAIDILRSYINGLEKSLSEKIRTNKELAAFIKALFDLNKINHNFRYENVDIIYAENIALGDSLIKYYKSKGYTFINHTSSSFKRSFFDAFPTDFNAHQVIGQEFDKVMVVLNSSFLYNEFKQLVAYENGANPNYLYTKMLFQEITRVRERLCVLVVGDKALYSSIMTIVKKLD